MANRPKPHAETSKNYTKATWKKYRNKPIPSGPHPQSTQFPPKKTKGICAPAMDAVQANSIWKYLISIFEGAFRFLSRFFF